ncbi:retrovirus-related pol polyprotein from transposon TNT 1-94 [Tanacetum coccineum]
MTVECSLEKEREVHAIKEIEKWLNESKMQNQEGMVNEGVALDVGLDSKVSTYDNTSTKQYDGSNSSGYDADAERALVDKTAQTLHMLLPKEDSVHTGKQGLGFENKNDVENPFVLNKAKEIAPSLYNIDKIGKDSLFDHKIMSEKELKLTCPGSLFRCDPFWGCYTIYPEIDPFLEDIEEEEKGLDDWDHLLDFNLDDVPLLGEEELSPFEERPIIETMAYHDKYNKILNEIWKDNVKLDGRIIKEEEEVVKRIKGEALKVKDNPEAFIFPIRLEGQVNKNALAGTGSDINTMPYRIYEQLGREEMKKVDRGITMINHTQAEAMGILTNVLCQVGVTTLIAKFLILDIPIDRDTPIVVGQGFLCTIGGIVNTPKRLFSMFDGFCHQTFRATRSDVMKNVESDSDDEEEYQIQRNKFGAPIYGRSLHRT